MHRLRGLSALLVAALVLVAAFAGLSAVRDEPRPPISDAAAARAVQEHPREASALARGQQWTRVSVTAVDPETARVAFFDGPEILAEAAVAADGTIERFVDHRSLDAPYGAPLTHEPWLIALGCVAFLLVTAVLPLRRLRNLDVLALLALVVPLLLLDAHLVVASTLAAVPPLAWLAGRCAWFALGARSADPPPQRPLLDALTPSWDEGARTRVLRIAVGAAGAAVAMVTISAPFTVDVGQAVMEGGTLLLQGTLPYGDMMPGDVFHGDTYPILSYLAYAPLAALMPVRDEWDVANGALIVAALSALAVAWMLIRSVDLRAALAWLVYPPVIVAASSGTSDLLLAALLVSALVLSRRRVASTGLLIAAGWFKLVPFALLPVWLARLRGRSLAAALGLLAGSALATLALLIALGGWGAPAQMLDAMTFQLERRTLHSPWALLGIEWLQPLAQAAVLALVAGATVRTWREPTLMDDPARLAALAGAVLLGLQLSGHYWTYLYLAWAVPCVVLALLADAPRPATASARAPRATREPALV
jgi:hypothetical protein